MNWLSILLYGFGLALITVGLWVWINPGAGLFAVGLCLWIDAFVGALLEWRKR